MKNEIYPIIREYVKQNNGWDSEKLKVSDEYKKYMLFQEELKKLDGKKVKIKFTCSMDLFSNSGEKTGRIKVSDDGLIRFYEGRKTARYYHLDGGLYEGWYATLIPLEITII
jgi:hypothetical protein